MIIDGRIEALLVQGLLVSMCAEFENILKDLTNARGKSLRESGICDYDVKYADRAFRSASPENIERAVW